MTTIKRQTRDGMRTDVCIGVPRILQLVRVVGAAPGESGGRKSPSRVQGQSHGRVPEGRSPPEA